MRHPPGVPELPDLTVYVECLAARCEGRPLERVRITGPSLLRSVVPPISQAEGRVVEDVRRLGKRIVFALEDDLFLVFHLMIAGRFQWRSRGAKPPRRLGLAALEFPNGTLLLTEASSKKRATLRTLKRALTDPAILSGIGNAYSDEILHRAAMSPVRLTSKLDDAEIERLFVATRETLVLWTDRLRAQVGDGFPEKVTAFHPEMAVHGRHGEPCPVCGDPVQRIVYASNETNYCATCQTGGKLLADRALSRLLKKDWPRSLEELEARRRGS